MQNSATGVILTLQKIELKTSRMRRILHSLPPCSAINIFLFKNTILKAITLKQIAFHFFYDHSIWWYVLMLIMYIWFYVEFDLMDNPVNSQVMIQTYNYNSLVVFAKAFLSDHTFFIALWTMKLNSYIGLHDVGTRASGQLHCNAKNIHAAWQMHCSALATTANTLAYGNKICMATTTLIFSSKM